MIKVEIEQVSLTCVKKTCSELTFRVAESEFLQHICDRQFFSFLSLKAIKTSSLLNLLFFSIFSDLILFLRVLKWDLALIFTSHIKSLEFLFLTLGKVI